MKNKLFKFFLGSSCLATVAPFAASCGIQIDHTYDEIVKELETSLYQEFEELDKRPRHSHELHDAFVYLTQHITDLGYEPKFDDYGKVKCRAPDDKEFGNIWFDVPATKGMENKEKVILQGHYDLVWAFKGQEHKDDPITLVKEKDANGKTIVHSKDYLTSIGADDGAGIALVLALLQNKNFKHGPLRVLFTADEETACTGGGYIYEEDAGKPDSEKIIDSDYLINVDGETEGEIAIGSAGVLQCDFGADFSSETGEAIVKDDGMHKYTLTVDGLIGGHSGIDINKNGGNAIKIANQIISKFCTKYNDEHFYIISYKTPNLAKDSFNAIPKKCVVEFVTTPTREIDIGGTKTLSLNEIVTEYEKVLRLEYPVETEMTITLQEDKTDSTYKTYNDEFSRSIVRLINDIPFGVEVWKDKVGGMPYASSNIAPIDIDADNGVNPPSFDIKTYSRVNKEDNWLFLYYLKLRTAADDSIGDQAFKLNTWMPSYDAKESQKGFVNAISKTMKSFGVEPLCDEGHGGLETSWFSLDNPSIKMAPIGPNIQNCHQVTETWEFDTSLNLAKVVLKTLASMPNKQ